MPIQSLFHFFACLVFHLFINPFIHPSIHPPSHPSIRSSTHPSIYQCWQSLHEIKSYLTWLISSQLSKWNKVYFPDYEVTLDLSALNLSLLDLMLLDNSMITFRGQRCKPQHDCLFWVECFQGPLMGTCCWEHPFLGKHKACLPSPVWLPCFCLMMIPPFLTTRTLPSSAKNVNFLENKAQVL